MKPEFQTYLNNLTRAHALAKPSIPPEASEEEIVQIIHHCAEQFSKIHRENDQILERFLFSRKAETLTREEADDLWELSGVLFNFNKSLDVGIAYRIHQLLYAYAEYHADKDMMVRELYSQGVTLIYLNVRLMGRGVNLFIDRIGECFQAGAAYLEQYEELTDPVTRGYMIRCLGNLKYGIKSFQGDNSGVPNYEGLSVSWPEYMDCFTRTMDVVESPYYRERNPEIPWDTFCYTMHYDRTQFLTALREKPDPVIAEAVMESAEYIYRHQEQIAIEKEKAVGSRTQYVYAAAKYHAGLIPVTELIELLYQIFDSADLHDFSGDNIWVCLYVPEYLMRYSRDLPDDLRQSQEERLQKVFLRQKEFLFLLPQNEYALQVSRALAVISEEMSTRDDRFSHEFLEYILACHPPTFVHSSMVARLCQRFCQRILEVRPELFDGMFGFEKAEAHKQEILDRAYQCGLYHDLGKCMLLRYVGLYTRKLLDEEFSCIKLHTIFGCYLLDNLGLKEMSDVAHYHHRSFDCSGGYPNDSTQCPQSIRTLVDLITVVDSLDAGTDNVGRSYASVKSFEQLVGELRAMKGTRYSPDIVELLDDPEFYSETEEFLARTRLEVYQKVYRSRS